MSKKFLQEIKDVYSPDYIKNEFVKVICFWCLQYYSEYEKAPESHIKDIFELARGELSEEEATIIEAFLTNLSEQYEEGQGINEEYILDTTFKYFKTRELELTAKNITKLLENNKVEEAEEQIANYKKVAKVTSKWYNPFDTKTILEAFDDENDTILRFPGQLGRMIGAFEREWLIMILGSFKRGKTAWMIEIAVLALFSRLKVVFISLEMKKKNLNKRIYKRITASSEEGEMQFIYPVFDCYYNQTGDCTKEIRTNNIKIVDAEGNKPEFTKTMKYKPCTVCRGTDEYHMATWFASFERPKLTPRNVISKTKAFSTMYGNNNLRVQCYPKFSANISDIKRDLDILEQVDGFIPDVIVIDYAGILRPEDSRHKKLDQIDETWKMLGQLAAERKCLVATGWQGNRGAIYKNKMDQESVSEWIGILGHVDVAMTLNQTKEEKRNKQMRIGLIGHRHKDFDEDEGCVVLQQADLGQMELDSERTYEWE